MRAKAVEIRWHGTQPIYSADFQPSPPSNLATLLQKKAAHPYALTEEEKQREAQAQEHGKVWRLATAGGDNMVMTWLVHPDPTLTLPSAVTASDPAAAGTEPTAAAPAVEYLATLQKHLGVVNVVRFCPKGEVLASAGDDGNVLLWVLSSGQGTTVFGETQEDRQYEREAWRTRLMLRGPAQCEIYDIAWSPSGEYLLTGDTAKTARIWNATDGSCIKQITEHTNFVQGVAWDPLGQYIATQSSDRSMHIYSISIQKDRNGAAVAECHHVGKHAKMDVVAANAGGSWSSSPTGSTTSALPAVSAPSLPVRPTPRRSMSNMSDVSMRSEASSSVHPPPRPPSSTASANLAPPTPSTSSMQPPSEIPHHAHHHSHSHSHIHATSIAPARSHSRQSSSSTHASPALSATTASSAHIHGARIARSPSPAPPLPAVAIEAEHHFRPSSAASNQATGSGADSGGLGGSLDSFKGREKGTIKLYGDEGASAFFRRLGFSTDGALLVSPAGKWEDPWSVGAGTANGIDATGKGKGKGKGKEAEEGATNGTSGGRKKRKIQLLHHGSSGSGAAGAIEGGEKLTVYIYGRAAMGAGKAPLAHLPGHRTSSVAIRFSPVVYRLRDGVSSRRGSIAGGNGSSTQPPVVELETGKTVEVPLNIEKVDGDSATNGDAPKNVEGEGLGKHPASELAVAETEDVDEEGPATASVFALPYRMVYAVATHDTVFVYDTQQAGPVCMFGNLHYASFTDVAWTADGRTLVLSSSDGYCSLVAFDEGELGVPMDLPPPPSSALTGSASAAVPNKVGSTPTTAAAPAPAQPTLKSSVQTSPRQPATGPALSGSPPLAPVAVASTTVGAAEAGEGQEADGEPKKKKRRVALTYEGPTTQ